MNFRPPLLLPSPRRQGRSRETSLHTEPLSVVSFVCAYLRLGGTAGGALHRADPGLDRDLHRQRRHPHDLPAPFAHQGIRSPRPTGSTANTIPPRSRSSTGSCATGAPTSRPRWTRASSTSSGKPTGGRRQPPTIRVVVSAYRSPKTNAMLRRRSRAVAEHSQHMLGKAMDTTMPNMSMEKVREIGMKLQRGGVGYYGASNFVHLDVGSVRAWPRMSYDQLARLFPDGKTVHLAADGRTLARYEEARAEIEATGGIAQDAPSGGKGSLPSCSAAAATRRTTRATEAARRGAAGPATAHRSGPRPRAARRRRSPRRNTRMADESVCRPGLSGERRARSRRPSATCPAARPTCRPTPAARRPMQKSPRLSQRRAATRPVPPRAPQATLPIPPRRPGRADHRLDPLPPTRPVQLATVIGSRSRAVAAYAADMSPRSAAPPSAASSRRRKARASRAKLRCATVSSAGSKPDKAPAQALALAYAPAGGATPGLPAVALGRPYLSTAADRPRRFRRRPARSSNFRALTGRRSGCANDHAVGARAGGGGASRGRARRGRTSWRRHPLRVTSPASAASPPICRRTRSRRAP